VVGGKKGTAMAERKKPAARTASSQKSKPAKVSDRVAGEAGRAPPKGKATPKQVQSLAGEVERQREAQKRPPSKKPPAGKKKGT